MGDYIGFQGLGSKLLKGWLYERGYTGFRV